MRVNFSPLEIRAMMPTLPPPHTYQGLEPETGTETGTAQYPALRCTPSVSGFRSLVPRRGVTGSLTTCALQHEKRQTTNVVYTAICFWAAQQTFNGWIADSPRPRRHLYTTRLPLKGEGYILFGCTVKRLLSCLAYNPPSPGVAEEFAMHTCNIPLLLLQQHGSVVCSSSPS